MNSIKTLINILKTDPSYLGAAILLKLSIKRMLNWMPDKMFINLRYRAIFHKRIDWKNPKTFNEKLQWIKLYDRNPEYIKMVDKYLVRDYIAEKIGEEHLIPLLGVYDSPEDIDYDSLPEQFVLKCNHDSGSVIICRDKSTFDRADANKKLSYHLGRNLYYWGREWPYKFVKPRIVVEKFLSELSGDVYDYKFFCFNGEVKCFKVDFDRFTDHRANYFDLDGNLLDCGEVVCPPKFEHKVEIPKEINEMIALAEKLSKGIPFLRVDFYNVSGKIYFGELTFFPATGFGRFTDDKWDLKLGEWLELPLEK